MRYSIGLVALILIFAQGCTTTRELKKARIRTQEREVHYSSLSGHSYRYPPRQQSLEPEMMAQPDLMELSNSPFTTEQKIVKVNPGRSGPAVERRVKQSGVVYNPFSGETVVIK